MNFKVAIVGAGQVASILAHRIPGSVRKVIIARRRSEAAALADEVGGIASDQMSAVRGCRVVFLAVPGTVIPAILQEIEPHLADRALVVNMAADLETSDLATQSPEIRLGAAKMIGDAREVAHGSPGVILTDHVEPVEAELLEDLLEDVGPVVRGDEAKVLLANTAIVEEMARAESRLRQRLLEVGLDRELLPAAVSASAPGVLRAIARGELSPFTQEVLRKMAAEETAPSRVST